MSSQGPRTDVRVAFLGNSTILTVTNGTYIVLPVQPKWSPDGTRVLFFISSNGTVLVSVDVASGSLEEVALIAGSYQEVDWLSPTEVAYSTLGPGGYQTDRVDLNTREGGVIASGPAKPTSPRQPYR